MVGDVIAHPPGQGKKAPVPCDPVNHPVVAAWLSLPDPRKPDQVDRIRKKEKAQVYRLGFQEAETRVIAKRGRTEHLLVERTIYESILPRLTLPALRYYGFVREEDDEYSWLFIEDAGDVPCRLGQDEVVAGRWLGTLHGGAAALELASSLPIRGAEHYRGHLRGARTTILGSLRNPALSPDDRGVLRGLVSSCDLIESRWSGVEAICDGLPHTLVHGDLAPPNLRLRHDGAGTAIVAFDWEWSGWGIPAVDVYQLARGGTENALRSYHSAISEYTDAVDGDQIRSLSLVGAGFRLLASVDWASTHLPLPRPESGMASLSVLDQPLREWGQRLA